MFRAFRFITDAGAYWSVVNDATYETVVAPDRFLQYVRFGRGRAESTTRKYAEAIALYAQLAARHDGVVHERNCHRSAYSLL
jgi:hypothetical protein